LQIEMAQALLTQVEVALGRLQVPQPPAVQTPATQVWPPVQTWPQAPQLLASLERFVSQPSVSRSPLQSPKPAWQAPLQTPCVHVGVATLFEEQTRPQPPQLLGSVSRAISQPWWAFWSQSAKPALQLAMAQALLTQVEVALARLQLVQALPPVQVPATQVWPPGQTWPQAPQLLTSVSNEVSQPSWRRLPLQSAKPVWQVPPHEPCVHVGVVTWFREQMTPQAPQLFGSVLTFVSQPFASRLSQLAKPATQLAMVQTFWSQLAVALGRLQVQLVGVQAPCTHESPAAQAWPQAPQLWTVVRSISQPSFALLLQSP
jgi:hypothetical protein